MTEFLDFSTARRFNREKKAITESIPKAGLNRGSMTMADDFDEPLPDEFWEGEINKSSHQTTEPSGGDRP